MEVNFQTKQFRRHAYSLGMLSFVVAVFGGVLLVKAPEFSAKATHAFFTPVITVTPTQNGLANIHITNSVDSEQLNGMTSVQDAGSRINTQFKFESAASQP